MPRGASGVLQRAHQEAEWAPETLPEEKSGMLAVPKCARTHTLDGIPAQREVRSSSTVRPKGCRCNQGTQERCKRGLKGCLGPPRRRKVAPSPAKRYHNRGL